MAIVAVVVGVGIDRGPKVGQFQANDDIGIGDGRGRRSQVMGSGKVHATSLINHLGLQQLRQLNQQANPFRRSGSTVRHNDRVGGIDQHLGGFFDRA